MKGFIEITKSNGKKQLVNINVNKIITVEVEESMCSGQTYTVIHYLDAYSGREKEMWLEETYEEVKEMITEAVE